MKGVIFNILEEFITVNFGEEKYETILSLCPLHTKEPFVGPGTYPDSDLMAIVGKAVETLGMPLPDTLKSFGKFMFPKLAKKLPQFVDNHKHPKSFLKTVDSIVHVEVMKLYKDSQPPRFYFEDPAPDRLILRYDSKRKLCPLVEGLLEGCADYYKTTIHQQQTQCQMRGADICEFDLKFI